MMELRKMKMAVVVGVLAASIGSYFIGGAIAMNNSPMKNVEIANEDNTEDIVEMTSNDDNRDMLFARQFLKDNNTNLIDSDAVPYRDLNHKINTKTYFYTDKDGHIKCNLFISNMHGSSNVFLTKILQTNKRIVYRVDRVSLLVKGVGYTDTSNKRYNTAGQAVDFMIGDTYTIWLDKNGNQIRKYEENNK